MEVGFIPGVCHYDGFDTAKPLSMFGGMVLALMLPERHSDELVVYQSQKGLFDTVFPHSCHAASRTNVDLLRRVKRKLFG